MRGLRVLVVGVSVAVACGGDDGVSISTNQDNVCSTIAEVACHNLYQCCSESEIEDYLSVSDPRTEAQCRDDLTKRCERGTAKLADSIKNNRASFDGKIMDACLNSVLAPSGQCASVDSMLPWVDTCADSAWTGKVADGGMCFAKYECASKDSYCSPNQMCTALPTSGMPCSTGLGCATGFYCNGSTCTALVAEGGMCTSTLQCTKPLFCDTSLPTPVCSQLKEGGQTCTSSSSCKSGDCLPGTCSNSPTSTCYTNAQCYGRCQTGNNFCTQDSNCGNGTCSNSPTTLCSSDFNCQNISTGSGSATSGTCQFTNHCVPGTCQGEVVCADAQIVVDYCTSALGALPVPPTN